MSMMASMVRWGERMQHKAMTYFLPMQFLGPKENGSFAKESPN